MDGGRRDETHEAAHEEMHGEPSDAATRTQNRDQRKPLADDSHDEKTSPFAFPEPKELII